MRKFDKHVTTRSGQQTTRNLIYEDYQSKKMLTKEGYPIVINITMIMIGNLRKGKIEENTEN